MAALTGSDEDQEGDADDDRPSEADVVDAITARIEALRESASRLERAEAQAERAIRLRKAGLSYGQIIASAERPLLLEIATFDLQAIAAAGTRLRRISARTLRSEGMSTDDIAREFGVSRQRISRLLHADPHSPGPTWVDPEGHSRHPAA
jgi:hypothetical protein